jgi:hypothetical protein
MSHSIIAPSSAYRWLNCPGSAKLESKYEDASSIYAEEGTNAHLLLEKCLRLSKLNADEYIGKDIMREDGGIFIVTEDMAENINWCLEFVREQEVLLGAKAEPEQRVTLGWIHPDLAGTCDITIRQELGKLVIADLKYGKGKEVDPVGNPQLMIYALGAMGKECLYEEVELVILQPRISREPKVWTTTPAELYKWAEKTLKKNAATAAKGSKSFKAGSWCDFCKAKADCPKLREKAMAVAGEVFGGAKLPIPTALTPEDLGGILPKLDIFDLWAKAVRERAESLLLSGQKVPGFKVVRGRTNRAWAAEEEAAKTFCELCPSAASEFFQSKFLSPAQLEKVIKTMDNKDELMSVLYTLLEQKEGKPTVVPESDKRQAIEFSNPVMFDQKDQEDLLA